MNNKKKKLEETANFQYIDNCTTKVGDLRKSLQHQQQNKDNEFLLFFGKVTCTFVTYVVLPLLLFAHFIYLTNCFCNFLKSLDKK